MPELFHVQIGRVGGTPTFHYLGGFLLTESRIQVKRILESWNPVNFKDTKSYIWMFPKIGVTPKSSHFNRFFHEINHPCWGIYSYFWRQNLLYPCPPFCITPWPFGTKKLPFQVVHLNIFTPTKSLPPFEHCKKGPLVSWVQNRG